MEVTADNISRISYDDLQRVVQDYQSLRRDEDLSSMPDSPLQEILQRVNLSNFIIGDDYLILKYWSTDQIVNRVPILREVFIQHRRKLEQFLLEQKPYGLFPIRFPISAIIPDQSVIKYLKESKLRERTWSNNNFYFRPIGQSSTGGYPVPGPKVKDTTVINNIIIQKFMKSQDLDQLSRQGYQWRQIYAIALCRATGNQSIVSSSCSVGVSFEYQSVLTPWSLPEEADSELESEYQYWKKRFFQLPESNTENWERLFRQYQLVLSRRTMSKQYGNFEQYLSLVIRLTNSELTTNSINLKPGNRQSLVSQLIKSYQVENSFQIIGQNIYYGRSLDYRYLPIEQFKRLDQSLWVKYHSDQLPFRIGPPTEDLPLNEQYDNLILGYLIFLLRTAIKIRQGKGIYFPYRKAKELTVDPSDIELEQKFIRLISYLPEEYRTKLSIITIDGKKLGTFLVLRDEAILERQLALIIKAVHRYFSIYDPDVNLMDLINLTFPTDRLNKISIFDPRKVDY